MTFLHSITKDIYITLAENPLISTKYAKIYIKGKFYESKRRKATGLKQTFCHGSRVAKGTKSAIYILMNTFLNLPCF